MAKIKTGELIGSVEVPEELLRNNQNGRSHRTPAN